MNYPVLLSLRSGTSFSQDVAKIMLENSFINFNKMTSDSLDVFLNNGKYILKDVE